nr:importin subunit beta-1 [Tanacetum cinerariifolium]
IIELAPEVVTIAEGVTEVGSNQPNNAQAQGTAWKRVGEFVVLETYMQTLFELTANAVKGDEENVALQAIGF